MGILVTMQYPGEPTWTLLARCLECNTEAVSLGVFPEQPTPLRDILGTSLYCCLPPLVFEFQGLFVSRCPDNGSCFSDWVLFIPLEMHMDVLGPA